MSDKRAEHRMKRALIRASKPAWRRCFWTWPWGHTFSRGRWAWEPITCDWCGKPYSPMSRSVHELVEAAERATGRDLDDTLVNERTLAAWRAS